MRFLITMSILLVVLASAAFAGSVDVATSFPAFQGQNGFRALAYNPDTGGFRDLQDLSSIAPKFYGTPEQPANMPSLRLVTEGVRFLPAWQRTVHGTEWPVLSFMASETGTYSVTGSFSNGNTAGATTRGVIFVNNSATSPLFTGNVTITQSAAFQIAGLHLNQGDYLRFGVDPLGSDSYDNTILNAVILNSPVGAQTPEPGSLLAIASGLVGLVAMRRRK